MYVCMYVCMYVGASMDTQRLSPHQVFQFFFKCIKIIFLLGV